MRCSILIPVYNEESTIEEVIEKIYQLNNNIDKQVIVIDDGSVDRTYEILNYLSKKYNFTFLRHTENNGKGAAIQTGLKYIQGDIVIFQDADLEINLIDYSKIIQIIEDNNVDIVLTYRIRSLKDSPSLILKIYYLGSRCLTLLANILFNAKIKDINSGCKAFRTGVLKKLNLESNGFNIDEEIIAKMLKGNYVFYEIPIAYYPRSLDQGKKIRLVDGPYGFLTLLKYKFRR